MLRLAVEMAQQLQLRLGDGLEDVDVFRDDQLEAGGGHHLVDCHARLKAPQPHPVRLLLEVEDGEVRDDRARTTVPQTRLAPAVPAGEIPGAGHPIDPLDETSGLMVGHDHSLVAQGDDVVGAAGAGKPHRRPVGIADQAGVDVAEHVDLGHAEKAVVEESALCHQEDVSGAGEHLGTDGGAHLVGRVRQFTGHQVDAHHAALENDCQARSLPATRQRSGDQRLPDAREHHLAVLEQPARGDRHDLVGSGVQRVSGLPASPFTQVIAASSPQRPR